MFLVKISYHHQRRSAIHYSVCVLFSDSEVASPAANPHLSVCLSVCLELPGLGWTVSTPWNCIFSTTCACPALQAQLLSGKRKEQFCWTGQMKNMMKFSVISNTTSPFYELFFPCHPRCNISQQCCVCGPGGGRGRGVRPGPTNGRIVMPRGCGTAERRLFAAAWAAPACGHRTWRLPCFTTVLLRLITPSSFQIHGVATKLFFTVFNTSLVRIHTVLV